MAEKNNVKLRSSKWLIIILCILIKVMPIPIFLLGIYYDAYTNSFYQELRSFDSGQEQIVKAFYGIPESIDVTLIVHRQKKEDCDPLRKVRSGSISIRMISRIFTTGLTANGYQHKKVSVK